MSRLRVDRRHFLLCGAAGLAAIACTTPAVPSRSGFDASVTDILRRLRTPVIADRTRRFRPDSPATFQRDLNAALRQLSEAGGGRLVVPPGDWLSRGPLRLQSGCDLHLESGAVVQFSGDPAHYLPVVFTRWEGTECYNYSPMIYGRDLRDVRISGDGTFDGQGRANFLPWRDRQRDDQQALRRMGREGTPVEARRFGEGHWLRPPFLQLVSCERVEIEGVTLRDSPFWCVHPVYCRDVTVRGITIRSTHVNSDGVDPDSSERVLIAGCDFDTGDDGVAVKSGRDQDGWRVGRPSREIVVRDCVYSGTAGGGVAIGSELSGGVERVFVDGYRMNRVSHGIYLKSNGDRGGWVRDCHFRNLRIGSAKDVLVITNAYKGRTGGDHPARFSQLSFTDIYCDNADAAISLGGDSRAPIRNVSVRDMTVTRAALPLRARHVSGLSFARVRANGRPVAALAQTPPETFEGVRHF